MFDLKEKPEVETQEVDKTYYGNCRKVKLKTNKDLSYYSLDEMIKEIFMREEEIVKEKIRLVAREIKDIYIQDMKAYKRSVKKMFDEFKTSFRNMVKANKESISKGAVK